MKETNGGRQEGRQVLYYEVDGEHYKVQGAPPIFGIYKKKKARQVYVLKRAVKARSGVLAFRKFLSELRETKHENE